jgi:ABC-type dipeptide/oligopeptide/nickel transport system permease subunit
LSRPAVVVASERPGLAAAGGSARAVRGGQQELWRRFWRNRLAVAGAALLLGELLVVLFGPWLAPYDPTDRDGVNRLTGPSLQHVMGTDDLGRDIFSRILHGAPLSMLEGVVVVVVAFGVGVPLGACAAYFRKLDAVIMRCTEVMLAFPAMLLALGLVAILGPGLASVLIGAGVAGIPPTTVLTRSLVLSVQQNEYVTAARTIGCWPGRILFRHILPNCISSLLVAASFRVALGILIASSLSFLGLGAQPPTPEWGAMLSNGRDFLYRAPHVAAFPGLALGATILAFNLLGDGLRDMFDPRQART